MPKMLVEETVLCYVTFRRIVDASTPEQAYNAVINGGGDELETEFGDNYGDFHHVEINGKVYES